MLRLIVNVVTDVASTKANCKYCLAYGKTAENKYTFNSVNK